MTTKKKKKFPHGTTNGYSNLGCRCVKCRAAWNRAHFAYMEAHPEQREKARRRGRISRGADPNLRRPAPKHGADSGIRLHKRQGTNLCRQCQALDKAEKIFKRMEREERRRPHGTEAALRAHYRKKEKPCAACKAVYRVGGGR